MHYVALLKQEKHGYGVVFPDFPECTTFGEDMDEAVDQAHEALAVFAELMLENGQSLPEPTGKKALLSKPENRDAKAINIEYLGEGRDFEEIGVTMHVHLLRRIERYCKDYGVEPADFLSVAAREALKSDPFAD